MDNAIPNPDVSFTRDGTAHRCAELFDSRDNARACRNCRTLMHYVLGHPDRLRRRRRRGAGRGRSRRPRPAARRRRSA